MSLSFTARVLRGACCAAMVLFPSLSFAESHSATGAAPQPPAGVVVTAPPTQPPAGGVATPPPPPPPANAVVTPPPPPPPAPQMQVFIAVNGQTSGPFNAQQLEGKAKAGELTLETTVWQDGMANWAAAKTVPEVQAIVVANPPAFDPKGFIVGSWQVSNANVPIPGVPGGGVLNGTTNYGADGSVTIFGTIQVSQPNPASPGQMMQFSITITASGTYTVTPMNSSVFIVNPTMTLTMSAPGMASQSQPANDPIQLTVIDRNTVRDSDGLVSRRVQ